MMQLEAKYPKIFAKLEDKDIELRHLLSIDANYEDYDSEEFEFDFEEYNYLVYITETLQNVLGEENIESYMQKLYESGKFENFLASEYDLYAIKTTLEDEQIADLFLGCVEELI
jgi:hypothetical protein